MGRPLAAIDAFLGSYLGSHRHPGDPNGVLVPSERPVARLGLALEPAPGLGRLCEQHALDALLLHRPWRLDPDALPPSTGVLAYHLSFDERMTLGYAPRLADGLGLRALEPIGYKEGRPIGMIGETALPSFSAALESAEAMFGGVERARPPGVPGAPPRRAAVVGAMTPELIREAAARGAGVYLTGAWRERARRAVEASGLGIIAVGHDRGERWGLRALAHLLAERFHDLETFVWFSPR